MASYKKKLNPFTGKLQWVLDETSIGILSFKPAVDTVGDLPSSGNTKNDARIVNDTHNLYVWDGSAWVDQGDIMDLDWSAIDGKPSSSTSDIDDAVSKKHTQNTDTKLDEGGANEVSASDVSDAVDKKHEHSNKALLDTYSQTEADIADAISKEHEHANKSDLDNVSGTNTGDETVTSLGDTVNGADGKTTPVDADSVGLVDSEASNIFKKLTWANIKATLKTYFDAIYTTLTAVKADSDISGAISHSDTTTGNPHSISLTDLPNVISATKTNRFVLVADGTDFESRALTEADISDLGTYQPTSEKGSNNGYASLDAGGKVPVAQLPNSIIEYQGTWDASTNDPSLSDGTGNAGDVYIVTVAGTQDLGSGSITFAEGDWIMYNGSIWQKSINSNAVVSVNSQTGVIVLDLQDVSSLTASEEAQLENIDDVTISNTQWGYLGAMNAQPLESVATSDLDSPTGSDTNVVTGTEGSEDDIGIWNSDGDLVGLTPSGINQTNLILNGAFSRWTDGTSSAPDGWTFGGDTIEQESSTVKIGDYSVKLTRSSTFTSIYQDVALEKGIDYWKGRTITFSCWVWSDTASIAKLRITDGIDTTVSDAHTGGSGWELITVTQSVNASATVIYTQCWLSGNGSAYFDGAMAVEGSIPFAFTLHPSDALANGLTPINIDEDKAEVDGDLKVTGDIKDDSSSATPSEILDPKYLVGDTSDLGGLNNEVLSKNVNSDNLLLNGAFKYWYSGTSSAPDGWALTRTSVARSAIAPDGFEYSAELTATDSAGLMGIPYAINSDFYSYLQGKTVTFSCWVKSSDANNARLRIEDGTSIENSSYHTGGGDWELLTVSCTIDSSASNVRFYLRLETNATSANFAGVRVNFGSIPFAYTEHKEDHLYEQSISHILPGNALTNWLEGDATYEAYKKPYLAYAKEVNGFIGIPFDIPTKINNKTTCLDEIVVYYLVEDADGATDTNADYINEVFLRYSNRDGTISNEINYTDNIGNDTYDGTGNQNILDTMYEMEDKEYYIWFEFKHDSTTSDIQIVGIEAKYHRKNHE